MRDRLIELVKEPLRWMPYGQVTDYTAQDIADYLLANGVIVSPCKVGDTVYWYGMVNHLVEAKIVAIDSGAKARVGEIGYEYDLLGEDFGKTVFFTKEEAEGELQKRGVSNAENN